MIYFLRTKHHRLNKNNWSKLTWLGNLWDDPMIHALFPVNSLTEFESYACFFFNFFLYVFIFYFGYWFNSFFNILSITIEKKTMSILLFFLTIFLLCNRLLLESVKKGVTWLACEGSPTRRQFLSYKKGVWDCRFKIHSPSKHIITNHVILKTLFTIKG